MGMPMVKNLLKNRFQVLVYDKLSEHAGLFQNQTANLRDVVANSDVVFTMLPTGREVREIYITEGSLSSAKKGTYIINCSTIESDTEKEIGTRALELGLKYLDAPVTGGTPGAINGTLSFMVGGSVEDFDALKPILMSMGSKAFYCGPLGSGQIAKVCNNLILGSTMIAVSQAFQLGIQRGLDPKVLHNIFNSGTAESWVTRTYPPVPGLLDSAPASNDFTPGFSTRLMSKDLSLAVMESSKQGQESPFIKFIDSIYKDLCQNWGDKDFSVIYKWLSEKFSRKNN